MANIQKALTADYGLSLGFNDDVGIFTSPSDPTVGAGEPAPTGSLLLRSNGELYIKVGIGDTEWFRVDTSAIVSSDLAALQVRRSTVFNVNPTFEDIDFDITDVETVPTEIEHDPVNRDRFIIKETGFYKVSYNASLNMSSNNEFTFRLRKNDTDEIIGSARNVISGNDVVDIGNDVILFMTQNEYLSLQISSASTINSSIISDTMVLNITKLRGQKGDKGDTGTGSNVNVEYNDVAVTGGPFTTLNFEGGLAVVDGGGGKVTITITASSNVPAVQLRNTTNINVPTAWSDVAMDTTDIETIASSINQDGTNTQRINILEDGLYEIGYYTSIAGDSQVNARVFKNNSIAVPGSGAHTSSIDTDDQSVYQMFYALLSAGDFITLQMIAGAGGTTTAADTTFLIARKQGIKGDTGPTGAPGSTGPQGAQGIQGPVGPAGSGGTVNVYEDGTLLGAFGDINFVGTSVTATDAGGGVTDIAITGGGGSPIFGSEYQHAESLSVAVTNSDVLIQKLRLTTTNLPAGTYRVGWGYSWNHDSNSDSFLSRVQLDDTTTYSETKAEPQDSAGSFAGTGTDQQYVDAGFFTAALSGVHTIDIDFATSNASNESSIWNARIELWRVQ